MKETNTYPWKLDTEKYSFCLPDGKWIDVTLLEAQELREQLARLIADNVNLQITTPIFIPARDYSTYSGEKNA